MVSVPLSAFASHMLPLGFPSSQPEPAEGQLSMVIEGLICESSRLQDCLCARMFPACSQLGDLQQVTFLLWSFVHKKT